MEERALYRAILAAPYDDVLRLAYADWLDENADALPRPAAERARAEFIRLQCASGRVPGGWVDRPQPLWRPPSARERRLLFHHGKKWRRAFPANVASAPFDRGFLRPFRAFTPQRFLYAPPAGTPSPFLPLPPGSPARRYVPEEDGLFAVAPLWDVHLYAPGWLNDPLADQGQYGPLLEDVARSPGLRQIGWLKLSFCRTPVLDFLRDGDFANLETLVLNSGPFPDVLEAVAGNASFRSLRYVRFGSDLWAWAPTYAERVRFYALRSRLEVLNNRHLPFGAMRGGIASVLRDTPLILPPPDPWPPAPTPVSPILGTAQERQDNSVGSTLGALAVVALVTAYAACSRHAPPSTYPPIKLPEYKPIEFKPVLPEYPLFPPPEPLRPAEYKEFQEAMKKWREQRPALPVAPPPRPVEPKAVSDEQ